MKRTHTCGELTLKNVNENVLLQGWVTKVRKMGAMNFIDLRDRYGITQLVIDESISLENVKSEYVLEVEGKVIERKSKNQELKTGEIEIKVEKITLINKSELTPFEIKDGIESQEDTRLTYRYLDLRRPEMQKNLLVRSKMNHVVRNFFVEQEFLEIETPIFGKSTPEGARDFLVPSRLNTGKFYALPQSPQLYKQLFMISGLDRYFQIVKCFRDEDLRIDRQPEFTQLDMEMSFADANDVMDTIESLVKKVILEIKGIEIKEPIQKISWHESMEKYGNDKPDLRFGFEIHTLNEIFNKTEIPLFSNLENKSIRAICVDSLLNKKELEDLTEVSKQNSVSILGFAKFDSNEWTGSIGSKLSDDEKSKLMKEFDIKTSSTILFVVEEYSKASQAMGAIRNRVAKLLNLLDPEVMKLAWIVDFPLFEFSEEENRYVAAHHPFTMPADESINNFDSNKKEALAKAYDIVLNGFEIGGGSQRITDSTIQKRMFDAIGLNEEQIESNFGWFVNAYKYGAPYHAGCALGLDRICMLLTGSENIREVIAFPKNSSGVDPMTNAPDLVTNQQLDELNIKLK
ncbi:aspartate--tRNA ligase [Spiroplasma monobiae]|uniref:Aspartate--tRNA ligase n=1 Tax=Spiroplasma monobiae MQ-1 TaxID=1336748 RepID=A0A2K9LUL9_SPISQ|nr:aspartate--tRNA ligase [Spiroplasma monobiae]AUM62611.1 aspartyl-tRNA synthetase [Spiroplasma monobiae MQ-1]